MELEEITYKINGCAMKVHNALGNGFQPGGRSRGYLPALPGH